MSQRRRPFWTSTTSRVPFVNTYLGYVVCLIRERTEDINVQRDFWGSHVDFRRCDYERGMMHNFQSL